MAHFLCELFHNSVSVGRTAPGSQQWPADPDVGCSGWCSQHTSQAASAVAWMNPHQCTGTDWRPADEECQSSQPRDLWQKLRENQTVVWSFHYHTSIQHGIMFNFWLCTYPLWNTNSHLSMDFIFHPMIVIWTAFNTCLWSTCPTQMPSGLYSRILRLRDGRPRQAKMHPSWNNPFDHSSLLNASSAPSWHLLLISAYSYGTHCGFQAYCTYIQWYCHHSQHSYWPTISSTFMTPETISFGKGHHRSQEGNMLYQGRRMGWWPLLDHLLSGLHRSWVLNSSQLRSCDRP